MNRKSWFFYGISLIVLSFGGWHGYKWFNPPPQKTLFTSGTGSLKTIARRIIATGTLDIKNNLQIGSLVGGTVQELYVKEQAHVTKGQKLALLTLLKDNTDVRTAQGELVKAQAIYTYKTKNYLREKKLFNAGFLSQDEFEKITQDYEIAQGDLHSKQALLDRAKIEYESRIIRAPAAGTIVAIGVTEGMKITSDLDPTVLFNLAPDTTKMEAILDIDETDIGLVAVGMKTKIIADGLPYETYKGFISSLNFSPCKCDKKKNNNNNGSIYEARVPIDDSKKLLRPGMSVSATVLIKKLKQTFCIPNKAIYINGKMLKRIADILHLECKELSLKEKATCKKQNQPGKVKFVWIVTATGFTETPVWTDISDDTDIAVLSGIDMDSKIVLTVEIPNELEEYYKKAFKTM